VKTTPCEPEAIASEQTQQQRAGRTEVRLESVDAGKDFGEAFCFCCGLESDIPVADEHTLQNLNCSTDDCRADFLMAGAVGTSCL
jgi:hypothetical protein